MLCQDTFARFYGERLWIYPVNMRPQKYMDRLLRGKGGWFMDSTGFTGVCRRIYVMYMEDYWNLMLLADLTKPKRIDG